ncbi:glycosyltransferase family 2 protein [Ferrimonas aestuarii]|uniref:Glycosyltransferase n=1 Tax=Ferrimonas aestuarii TaxID=2569539 RepID=A0A4V5NVW5_9GAMM|nr:cellulose synthase catalytic subunit [Ferrimonas aestuarii]TKB53010.1 glycosyltransferase [Ferrimonas aestuarii]
MGFYFEEFEGRKPPKPLKHSPWRELLFQFLATVNLTVGAWYIWWRWTESLNYDALWFAIPLVVAETCAYIGLVLFSINLWKTRDYQQQPPPKTINDCLSLPLEEDRVIYVDLFFPSYDEEVELVRLSVQDAKRMNYPHNIDIRIAVLDDGKRPAMQAMAEEEGVDYITREGNIGFKAGNLRNAMEQTSGDFIVICDADTRPFPTMLEHCLGYFRDPDVAWVQTPQWFFDLPEGKRLPLWLQGKIGAPGRWMGKLAERVYGPITIGQDPFVNDPQMFYDVIQRRRNWANASFCCGAGSIHRREAVMEAALKSYSENIDKQRSHQDKQIKQFTGEAELDAELQQMMDTQTILDTEFTPYKFHVSEDIYTSVVLHADPDRDWKSVMHPQVESKMLSPQDLQTWVIQRFKYAGGTLDIAKNDNPLFRPGMSFKQRLMYATTVWSYLGALWNVVFLLSPIVYLLTGIAPVSAYSQSFYLHFIPFIICNELATMAATWGLAGFKGKANYLAFFPVNLRAIWTVLKGQEIKFPTTPKERQEGNFFHLVLPQAGVMVMTLLALMLGWLNMEFNWYGDHSLSGMIVNTFWGLNNVIAMSGLVMAAFWKPEQKLEQSPA